MKNVLYFDKMLTPKIITLVYWVMLFAAIVSGLVTMFSDFSIVNFLLGLVYAAVGAIGARIWCELLIVLFKMNEALQEVRQK